jgi:hypothetical protein
MPYTAFDATKPDATADNGTNFATNTRNNLKAIRDAAIMGGGFYGWNMAASGGTAAEPATLTYSKSTERVRASLTWSSGKVTVAVYAYSSTSGSSYDTIGTNTITYDGSDNVTATTWS